MARTDFTAIDRDAPNSFTFLRFALAACVIFSHSFWLLGAQGEPTWRLTFNQLNAAEIGVDFFFVISGFLVTHSWLRSRGVWDYARKRLLRIYPAFVVMALVVALIVGPLGSTGVSGYLHALRPGRLLASIVGLREPAIPPVFGSVPRPYGVNGSVWTIRIELECYVLVALVGLCGLLRRRAGVAALFAATILLEAILRFHPALLPASLALRLGNYGGLLRFVTYFLAGMTLYLYRERIPRSIGLCVAAVAVLAAAGAAGALDLALPLFGSYLLLCVAFAPAAPLQRFGRNDDLSYGVYLYAWPVQQLLIQEFRDELGPYSLSAITLVITCMAALVSWNLVEKPALRLKHSRRRDRHEQAVVETPVEAGVPAPAVAADGA